MTAKRTRNLSASVAARLLERAKRTGEDYQALLTAFFCERFLYRLGLSGVRRRFVLKGAMLLRVWSDQPYRATRDLDLLRHGDGTAAAIRADIEAICTTAVEPDGVEFDPGSIRLEAIRPEDEYVGTRVRLIATCGTVRLTFQVDVGVGDPVWPPPQVHAYPVLLDFPAPKVLAYSPESVIAEKFEAVVVLGDRNSRIKDFFDLHHLAGRFEFDGPTLVDAIRRTFEWRHTPLPTQEPAGFTAEYWTNPARVPQIRAFARRAGFEVGPNPGESILGLLRAFLLPILDDLRRGTSTSRKWRPSGPWR